MDMPSAAAFACTAAGFLVCMGAALLLLHRQKLLLPGRRGCRHLPSLEGKHVLITGGSAGIGLALAKECLSQGASVSLISRSSARLSAAASSLTCSFGSTAAVLDRILLKAADVSNADAISAAIKENFEWKPIDVLICNAGIAAAGLFGAMDVTDIEHVVKTNVLGCVYTVHAALPLMKARSKHHPSSVVLMSSVSGLFFLSNVNIYAATKYAVKGLAEMLRFELMPHQIKVGVACPSFVETAFLDEADKALALNTKILSQVHLYDRGSAQTADEVAGRILMGVKRGDFLITTCGIGFILGVLGRGFIPSDSLMHACIELVCMVPLRLSSFFWYAYLKRVMKQAHSHAASNQSN